MSEYQGAWGSEDEFRIAMREDYPGLEAFEQLLDENPGIATLYLLSLGGAYCKRVAISAASAAAMRATDPRVTPWELLSELSSEMCDHPEQWIALRASFSKLMDRRVIGEDGEVLPLEVDGDAPDEG